MAATLPVVLTGAVEGIVDEAILRRLAREIGASLGPISGLRGKDHLLKQLPAYNRAAEKARWVVLVDLDRDMQCAPACRARWLPQPVPRMHLRIVVRAAEAWLIADRQELARFLDIAIANVPRKPEAINNPKLCMVKLARKSRNRRLREDMVPEPSSGRVVAAGYSQRLIEFVNGPWRPQVAAKSSDSLRRCLMRMRELATR